MRGCVDHFRKMDQPIMMREKKMENLKRGTGDLVIADVVLGTIAMNF